MSDFYAPVQCFVPYGKWSDDDNSLELKLPFTLRLKRDYAYWYSCFMKEVKKNFCSDVGEYINTYFFKGPKEAEKYLKTIIRTDKQQVKRHADSVCKLVHSKCISGSFIYYQCKFKYLGGPLDIFRGLHLYCCDMEREEYIEFLNVMGASFRRTCRKQWRTVPALIDRMESVGGFTPEEISFFMIFPHAGHFEKLDMVKQHFEVEHIERMDISERVYKANAVSCLLPFDVNYFFEGKRPVNHGKRNPKRRRVSG